MLRDLRRDVDLHRNIKALARHADSIEDFRNVPFLKLNFDSGTRHLNDAAFCDCTFWHESSVLQRGSAADNFYNFVRNRRLTRPVHRSVSAI